MKFAICQELFEPSDDSECPLRDKKSGIVWELSVVEMLLEWYLERAHIYSQWIEDHEYRGSRFSHGAWHCDVAAVQRDVPIAFGHVDQALDATRFTTLDEWLEADLAGTLYYRGSEGGMSRVARENRPAARRKCACGEKFVPKRRRARRCEKCLALARTERAMRTAR